MASVVAVCISERKGAQKHEVPEIQLRQYRIMEQVLSPKDFAPRESVEKAGILDVFPFFHTAQLGQKIRRKPQSPLCGVALVLLLERLPDCIRQLGSRAVILELSL